MALILSLCFQPFPPFPQHRGSAVTKTLKTCWTSTTTGKKTFPAQDNAAGDGGEKFPSKSGNIFLNICLHFFV